jgi:hypothetical protein
VPGQHCQSFALLAERAANLEGEVKQK